MTIEAPDVIEKNPRGTPTFAEAPSKPVQASVAPTTANQPTETFTGGILKTHRIVTPDKPSEPPAFIPKPAPMPSGSVVGWNGEKATAASSFVAPEPSGPKAPDFIPKPQNQYTNPLRPDIDRLADNYAPPMTPRQQVVSPDMMETNPYAKQFADQMRNISRPRHPDARIKPGEADQYTQVESMVKAWTAQANRPDTPPEVRRQMLEAVKPYSSQAATDVPRAEEVPDTPESHQALGSAAINAINRAIKTRGIAARMERDRGETDAGYFNEVAKQRAEGDKRLESLLRESGLRRDPETGQIVAGPNYLQTPIASKLKLLNEAIAQQTYHYQRLRDDTPEGQATKAQIARGMAEDMGTLKAFGISFRESIRQSVGADQWQQFMGYAPPGTAANNQAMVGGIQQAHPVASAVGGAVGTIPRMTVETAAIGRSLAPLKLNRFGPIVEHAVQGGTFGAIDYGINAGIQGHFDPAEFTKSTVAMTVLPIVSSGLAKMGKSMAPLAVQHVIEDQVARLPDYLHAASRAGIDLTAEAVHQGLSLATLKYIEDMAEGKQSSFDDLAHSFATGASFVFGQPQTVARAETPYPIREVQRVSAENAARRQQVANWIKQATANMPPERMAEARELAQQTELAARGAETAGGRVPEEPAKARARQAAEIEQRNRESTAAAESPQFIPKPQVAASGQSAGQMSAKPNAAEALPGNSASPDATKKNTDGTTTSSDAGSRIRVSAAGVIHDLTTSMFKQDPITDLDGVEAIVDHLRASHERGKLNVDDITKLPELHRLNIPALGMLKDGLRDHPAEMISALQSAIETARTRASTEPSIASPSKAETPASEPVKEMRHHATFSDREAAEAEAKRTGGSVVGGINGGFMVIAPPKEAAKAESTTTPPVAQETPVKAPEVAQKPVETPKAEPVASKVETPSEQSNQSNGPKQETSSGISSTPDASPNADRVSSILAKELNINGDMKPHMENHIRPIAEAIANKDVEFLRGWIIGDKKWNANIKRAFTIATGVELPGTQKGDWAALDAWAGISPDERANRVATANAKRAADRQSQADGRTDSMAASTKLRIGKDGPETTIKAWVDERVADGYTRLVATKRGSVTQWNLVNSENNGYPVSTKVLEYARVAVRRAGEKQSKQETTNAIPKQGADESGVRNEGVRGSDQPARVGEGNAEHREAPGKGAEEVVGGEKPSDGKGGAERPDEEAQSGKVKQPWEMTRDEFAWGGGKTTTVKSSPLGDAMIVSDDPVSKLSPEAFDVFTRATKSSKNGGAGGVGSAVDASKTTPEDRRMLAELGLSATTDRMGSPMMAVSQRKRADITRRNVEHKRAVEQAIREGKTVPPEVLADYPDLAAKYAKGESANVQPDRKVDDAVTPPASEKGGTKGAAKAGPKPWDNAKTEDEDKWYGTPVEVSPQMKGEEPYTGTVVRVLNGGKAVEVRPDGESHSTFRVESDRVTPKEKAGAETSKLLSTDDIPDSNDARSMKADLDAKREVAGIASSAERDAMAALQRSKAKRGGPQYQKLELAVKQAEMDAKRAFAEVDQAEKAYYATRAADLERQPGSVAGTLGGRKYDYNSKEYEAAKAKILPTVEKLVRDAAENDSDNAWPNMPKERHEKAIESAVEDLASDLLVYPNRRNELARRAADSLRGKRVREGREWSGTGKYTEEEATKEINKRKEEEERQRKIEEEAAAKRKAAEESAAKDKELGAAMMRNPKVWKPALGGTPESRSASMSELLGRELNSPESSAAIQGRLTAPIDRFGIDFLVTVANSPEAFKAGDIKAAKRRLFGEFGWQKIEGDAKTAKPPKEATQIYSIMMSHAGNGGTRYSQDGIYHDKGGAVVTTDGHRMLVAYPKEIGVDVGIPKGKIWKYDGKTATEQEGTFPPYRDVIPQNYEPGPKFSGADLRRVEGTLDASIRGAGFTPDGVTAGETMPTAKIDNVYLNPSYLYRSLRSLRELGADTVEIRHGGHNQPVRLIGTRDGRMIGEAIVMPVNGENSTAKRTIDFTPDSEKSSLPDSNRASVATEAARDSVSREDLESTVSRGHKPGEKYVIHKDESDLPDNIKQTFRQQDAEGRVRAFVDKDGVVHYIRSNIESPAAAENAVRHERFHLAEGGLSEGSRNGLVKFAEANEPDIVRQVRADYAPNRHVSEIGARLAELYADKPAPPWYKRWIDAVTGVFRKALGMPLRSQDVEKIFRDLSQRSSESPAERDDVAMSKKPADERPDGEPEETTGIKNAVSAEVRRRQGWPERNAPGRRSFEETYRGGLEAAERDPNAMDTLMAKLKQNKEYSLDTVTESGLALKKAVDIENRTHELMTAMDKAKTGPDADAARAELALHLQQSREFRELMERTGTASGRSLNARRMMSNLDYTLSSMLARADIAKGERLTPAEIAEIRQQNKELTEANARLQKAEETAQSRIADAESKWHFEKMQRDAAEAKAAEASDRAALNDPLYQKFAAKIAERAGQKEQALLAKIKQRNISDYGSREYKEALLATMLRMRHGKDAAAGESSTKASIAPKGEYERFTEECVKLYGEGIRPHMKELYAETMKAADDYYNKALDKEFGEKAKRIRNAKAPTPDEVREDLLGKMRKRMEEDDATPANLRVYIQKLGLELVRSGIRDRETLIDALHHDVKGIVPDITREETRDILSGYGDFKQLDKDVDKTRLREIKAESQKLAQLEALQRREPPLRTGLERQPPNDETRRLTKQVNDLKRELGIQTTDPETQLRSSIESLRTRLRNQIKDLQTEIDTGVRMVRGKPKPISAPEIDALRKQLAEVRKLHEQAFGKKELSDEQRLAIATKAAQRALQLAHQRLADASRGVFETPSAPKISSVELDSLRSQIAVARAQYAELKANDPAQKALADTKANAAFRARLAERSAELTDRMARGDYSPRPQRERLQLDPESQRAQVAANRIKQQYESKLAEYEASRRPAWVKSLDFTAKWARMSVLSGFGTLAKLPAATLHNFVNTPLADVLGSGIKQLPGAREIFEKAPIEGAGFNPAVHAVAVADGIIKGLRGAYKKLASREHMSDEEMLIKGPGKTRDMMEIFGILHGAMKEPAKQFDFHYALSKYVEWGLRNGHDVTDPAFQATAMGKAWEHAERSIFQEHNSVVSALRNVEHAMANHKNAAGELSVQGQLGALLLRANLPVVSVPTNIVSQTFGDYIFGLPRGIYEARRAIQAGMDKLSPEQADVIARHLKRGSLGAAYAAAGLFLPQIFGGFFQKGQKRDEKNIEPEGIRVGEVDIPRMVLHHPVFLTANFFAQIQKTAEERVNAVDPKHKGYISGILAAGHGLAEQVPMMQVYSRASADGMVRTMVPQLLQQTARFFDERGDHGKPVPRKPSGPIENIKVGIPGLRSTVPINDKLMQRQRHIDMVDAIRKDATKGDADLSRMVQEKKLTVSQAQSIRDEAATDPQVWAIRHSPVEQAAASVPHFDPKERARYEPMIANKIASSNLSFEKQDALYKQSGITPPQDLAIQRLHKALQDMAHPDTNAAAETKRLRDVLNSGDLERGSKAYNKVNDEYMALQGRSRGMSSEDKLMHDRISAYMNAKANIDKQAELLIRQGTMSREDATKWAQDRKDQKYKVFRESNAPDLRRLSARLLPAGHPS